MDEMNPNATPDETTTEGAVPTEEATPEAAA